MSATVSVAAVTQRGPVAPADYAGRAGPPRTPRIPYGSRLDFTAVRARGSLARHFRSNLPSKPVGPEGGPVWARPTLHAKLALSGLKDVAAPAPAFRSHDELYMSGYVLAEDSGLMTTGPMFPLASGSIRLGPYYYLRCRYLRLSALWRPFRQPPLAVLGLRQSGAAQ